MTVEESPDGEDPLKQQDVVLLAVEIEHEEIGDGYVHKGTSGEFEGNQPLTYDVPPAQVPKGIYSSIPDELLAVSPTFAWDAFVGELNQTIAEGKARLEHSANRHTRCFTFGHNLVLIVGTIFVVGACRPDILAYEVVLASAYTLCLLLLSGLVLHFHGKSQRRNVLLSFHDDLQQVCSRYSIIKKADELCDNRQNGVQVHLNFEGPCAVFEDVECVANREGVPQSSLHNAPEVHHIRCKSLNIRINYSSA